MTNHPNRSKHQRGARCIYRDLTARELDRAIDTQAELLAVLKRVAAGCETFKRCGGFDLEAWASHLGNAEADVRAAIAKAEGR